MMMSETKYVAFSALPNPVADKLFILKVKGKIVPAMKAYGSGCIDPHFLDLGTSWR
jgi:hypothetical protein